VGVYQRGTVWYIDYYAYGKRARESAGPNKKLAEAILAKRKTQVKEKKFLDIKNKKRIRFETLAEAYLDYSKTNKRSWKRDEVSLRPLKRFFGNRIICQINPIMIEEYKKMRLTEISPASVNRELACLKHMFNKAIEWDKMDSNPGKKVKLLRENNVRLRYLSSEEATMLFENCADHLKPIVLTALYTGMRKSEILKLKWEDVDLNQRIIFVRYTKNNQVREIPINNLLTDVLKSIKFKSPYVFCNENGRPYANVRKSFASALRKACIEDFRFHDLRHTFASHLVMSGVDLMTVKELLGHKTIKMTLRYAHLSLSHKRRAIEALEYFDGRPDGHRETFGEVTESANSLF
jgi:integrase